MIRCEIERRVIQIPFKCAVEIDVDVVGVHAYRHRPGHIDIRNGWGIGIISGPDICAVPPYPVHIFGPTIKRRGALQWRPIDFDRIDLQSWISCIVDPLDDP